MFVEGLQKSEGGKKETVQFTGFTLTFLSEEWTKSTAGTLKQILVNADFTPFLSSPQCLDCFISQNLYNLLTLSFPDGRVSLRPILKWRLRPHVSCHHLYPVITRCTSSIIMALTQDTKKESTMALTGR